MSQHNGAVQSHGPEVTPYQFGDGTPEHSDPYATGLEVQYVWPYKKEFADNVQHVSPPAPARKKIAGLSVPVFCAVVGLVLLVLGVGLGVGLGIGLQSKHHKSASPTPTSSMSPNVSNLPESSVVSSTASKTSTSSSPLNPTATGVTSGTHGLAAQSCTFSSQKNYDGPDDSKFTVSCYTDWADGEPAADGHGVVTDIKAVLAYTFEDCMAQCVTFNHDQSQSQKDVLCKAVTYNANLTQSVEVKEHDGNCFLKRNAGIDMPAPVVASSAKLISI